MVARVYQDDHSLHEVAGVCRSPGLLGAASHGTPLKALSFGEAPLDLAQPMVTHRSGGTGVGKVLGRVHTSVGLQTLPLGPPAAPRSPTGKARGRKAPSYRVRPRGGNVGVLMMERL